MADKTTRREFLKQAAALGLGLAGLSSAGKFGFDRAEGAAGKSRVVLVRDGTAQDQAGNFNQGVIQKMLQDGMLKLTGKSSAAAWKQFVKPHDIVGVKVNCLFGKGVSTHPEVTNCIAAGLKSAGVKAENIIIWDRTDSHLLKVGYSVNRGQTGVKCYGTQSDYEPEETHQGSFHGRLSQILTRQITTLVNAPILKHHGTSGVSLSLKNHLGTCHNPGAQHGDHCDPFLADLNSVPAIRSKTKIVICDGIRAQCNGGPGLRPDFGWPYNGLLISTDPVALDYIGWWIIETRRKETGLRPLGVSAKHIATAAQRGLGTIDPNKIDLVQVQRNM